MNMNQLIHLGRALFQWILQTTWQASVLAVLIVAAQWLLRKRLSPAWRCGLWLLLVIRLLMPVPPPSGFSIFNLAWLTPRPPAAAGPTAGPAGAFAGEPAGNIGTDVPALAEPRPTPLPVQRPAAARLAARVDWVSVAFGGWLAGVCFFGARLVWTNVRFRSRIGGCQPVTQEEVLRLLEDCRASLKIRRPVRLIESEEVESPAVYGLGRPWLLLPDGVFERFSLEELRCIFLHELAHIKRGDLGVNWLVAGLQVLHWFNPVLWLAWRRLRADRELATDALALAQVRERDRAPYGETILKVLEELTGERALPGLVGIVESKAQMQARIRAIARGGRFPRWSWGACAVAIIIAAIALTDARDTAAPPPSRGPAPKPEIISGTVLLPDGKPATGAGVSVLCLPPGWTYVSGISWAAADNPGLPLPPRPDQPGGWTDPTGRFSILTASNATVAFVTDPLGFAMVPAETLATNPTVPLEPWGRITGTARLGAKPATNMELFASLPIQIFPGLRQVGMEFDAWTDANGRFVFEHVPPGHLGLGFEGKGSGIQGNVIRFGRGVSQSVDVAPGATVETSLVSSESSPDGSGVPKSAQELDAEKFMAQAQADFQAQVAKEHALPNPEPPLSGTVLLPDGRPAEGARVVRWGDGIGLQISNATIWADTESQGPWATNPIVANTNRIMIADAAGRFVLPEMIDTYASLPPGRWSRTQWVFATRLDGYASAPAASVKAGQPMTLRPWGRIEGTLRFGGQPVTNASVRLEASAPNVYEAFAQGNTDEQGRFVLTNVPSERFTLAWNVRSGPARGERGTSQPIEVRPGGVTTIALGGTGRPVTGRLVANTPVSGLNWKRASIRLETTPAAWPVDSFYFQPAISDDGTFRFDDVPAGTYQFSADFNRNPATNFMVAGAGQTVVVPEITGGRGGAALDLGEIKMRIFFPPGTLKAGDLVPPMEVTELGGKAVKLEDFRGKYVLLRFLGQGENGVGAFVTALARAYQQDPRLVVMTVGFTSNGVGALAHADGTNQVGNCVYAYSGLSPFFTAIESAVTLLVGPDGRVIATDLQGNSIRTALGDALGNK
jgi:beta-lactamase regulating signal transducer with metallopeptidase domain